MFECPFCGRELGTIKNHFPSCKEIDCPPGVDPVVLGYERLYGVDLGFFHAEYLGNQKGLKTLVRETGIPYRVLRYLADAYGVFRECGDAVRLQNEKNKKLFMDKYGVENPFQLPAVVKQIQSKRDSRRAYESAKKTNMERYGVENPFQLPRVVERNKQDIVLKRRRAESTRRALAAKTQEEWEERTEKTKRTNMERYGVENPFQLRRVIEANKADSEAKQKRRKTMERIGLWKSDEERTDYERYASEVRRHTRRNRKKVFASWDGCCFYDGCRLITNDEFAKRHPGVPLARNAMRPTIDHKESVICGFKSGTPPDVIGGVDNLCVCSQSVNSQKNYRSMVEFLGEAEDVEG